MAPFKVLANSLPRGGPFLLAGALETLGFARYPGGAAGVPRSLNFEEVKNALRDAPAEAGAPTVDVSPFAPWPVPPTTLRRWLDAVAPGQYLMAHLGGSAALPPLLAEAGYRHVTILRDPAALLAAMLFEDQPMPRFLRADFATLSPNRRLEFLWNGGPVAGAGVVLKPYAEVYRSLLAWTEATDGLVVRFEDLADAGARRREAVERIAAYLGVSLTEDQATRLDAIEDPSTRHFPADREAEWAEVIGAALAARLRELCEPLRRKARYDA